MEKEKREIKNPLIWVLIILIVLGLFYWFQWRPSQIRRECHKFAINAADKEGFYSPKAYDSYYEACLRSKGLK